MRPDRLLPSWRGPYWEPRDIWIGVYWVWEELWLGDRLILEFLSVYVCLLPCFPIRMRWYTHINPDWIHQEESSES